MTYQQWLDEATAAARRYADTHGGQAAAPSDIAHILWRRSVEVGSYPTLESALAEWGPGTAPDPTPEPWPNPRRPVERITAQGRRLVTAANGRIFRWRAITAFALPAQIIQRREADAIAFMDAAASYGFNLVRVLTMCEWLKLHPDDGRSAIPRLLALAAERHLYVELVALADTRAFGFDEARCQAHLGAVGSLVRDAPHAMVQVANEHYHATQIDWLHDERHVAELGATLRAQGVLYTESPSVTDEALTPTGAYITRHLDRSRDPWNMVRRIRELESVSASLGRHVVNDEMIGFAEQDEPGRRCADPAIAFAAGVLGRIFEVGTTFHCQAGLRCDPLGPIQAASALAMVVGNTMLHDDDLVRFQNANNPRPDGSRPWPMSPVQMFDERTAIRAYSGLATETRGITAVVGVTGKLNIEWGHGWTPDPDPVSMPGIQVFTIRR